MVSLPPRRSAVYIYICDVVFRASDVADDFDART